MRTKRMMRAPGAHVAAGALILALPATAFAFGEGPADTPNPAVPTSTDAIHADVTAGRVAYGRDVVVEGRLPTTDAGRALALEFQAAGATTWRTVADTTAGRNGGFTFRAPLRRSGRVRVTPAVSHGVVNATAPSTAPYGIAPAGAAALAPSAADPVQVGSKLLVSNTTHTLLSGAPLTVAGRLEPATAGRVVSLQARSAGGWQTIATTRTGDRGGFNLRYTGAENGSRSLRVRFAGDRGNAAVAAPAGSVIGMVETVASWYYDAGNTACGFHATYGVANLTLPCGTKVTISYGGRSVLATVDDRGPYVGGRSFDLDQNTAQALGMAGVATVEASLI
jgi:rare lipoprotein A